MVTKEMPLQIGLGEEPFIAEVAHIWFRVVGVEQVVCHDGLLILVAGFGDLKVANLAVNMLPWWRGTLNHLHMEIVEMALQLLFIIEGNLAHSA